MKKTRKILVGTLGMLSTLLFLLACEKLEFMDDKAGFDEQGDLSQFSVRLQAFQDTDGNRVVDFNEGTVYTIEDMTPTPEKVDLLALWSADNGISFVSVLDIPALRGSVGGDVVNSEWHVKNETTFIRLESAAAYRERYEDLATAADVRNLYEWGLEEVAEQPNYDEEVHGPYMSVKGLSDGDLVLAKTQSGIYVAALVSSADGGPTGNIQLRVKVDKSSYVPVPELDPVERMDVHLAEMGRPNYTGDLRFLDVSTGALFNNPTSRADYSTHSVYFQDRVDLLFVNSGDSGHNLRSPSNSSTGWGTTRWVVEDWVHRNSSVIMRLPQSEYTDSLYTYTYLNSQIRDAWDEVELKLQEDPDLGQGPRDFVTGVTLGDLILFKSESRNTYALMKVIDWSPTASGHATLSIKVDNSNRVNIPPLQQMIMTGVPGYQFIDFETATIVPEANGQALAYGPERFDVHHAKGSGTNHNFISATSEDAFAAFSASLQTRINEWPVRNHTEMIVLPSGADTDELYRALSDGDYEGMLTIWNTALEDEYEPSTRVVQLAAGQVALINSIDRGRFIVTRVLYNNNTQASGSMSFEYKQATAP